MSNDHTDPRNNPLASLTEAEQKAQAQREAEERQAKGLPISDDLAAAASTADPVEQTNTATVDGGTPVPADEPTDVLEIVGQSAEDLPEYDSHKVVRAGKILDVTPLTVGGEIQGVLTVLAEPGKAVSFTVPQSFMSRFTPREGSFYVLYADGYASISPAEAFEDGYTRRG